MHIRPDIPRYHQKFAKSAFRERSDLRYRKEYSSKYSILVRGMYIRHRYSPRCLSARWCFLLLSPHIACLSLPNLKKV